MTTVFQELLPESYLLLLMPGSAATSEPALENGLRNACHSGKASVWIDCGLVHYLSAEAAQMLWDYHFRLQAQNIKLMVVHASDDVKQELLNWQVGSGLSLCFVPTLLDAAWQSGVRQMA